MAGTNVPFEAMNLVEGTAGDDTLRGTSGHDAILGIDFDDPSVEDGDDWISAGAGDDEAIGGIGRDTIYGGSGNDSIMADGVALWNSAAYVARVLAGEFDDVIYAGFGDDFVTAELGNDRVDLGAGDDMYINNWAYGPGVYLNFSHPGADTVYGGAGNDTIEGHTVYGGTGNDHLFEVHNAADSSRSRLYGGDGNDTIEASHNAFVSGGNGKDQIFLGYQIKEILTEDFSEPYTEYGPTGKNEVYGGAGDDTISRVASGKNKIWGGAGNDKILTQPVAWESWETPPASLGGDRFYFAKGHATRGGDVIEGFQKGVDKIDLSLYDLNGDGAGDLTRSNVKFVQLEDNTTQITFNGEVVTVEADGYLNFRDVVL